MVLDKDDCFLKTLKPKGAIVSLCALRTVAFTTVVFYKVIF